MGELTLFEQYERRVEEQRVKYPEWRAGQTYFNVLYFDGYEPEFANAIRGGPIDPFHRDDVIPQFLEAVREQLARVEAFDRIGKDE